jgi:hypothetical protein
MDIVISYATSGDRDLEPKVFRFFQELYPTGRTVAIPVAPALSIVSHIIPILKEASNTSGWYILWALSSPLLNANAFIFLNDLQDLPCCDEILSLNWQLLRFTNIPLKRVIAIRFIAEFVNFSPPRQHMLFKYPDLIREIIVAVEKEPAGEVVHLDQFLAARALINTVQAVKPDLCGPIDDFRYDCLEMFLRYNGLHALCLALDHYAQIDDASLLAEYYGENPFLSACVIWFSEMLCVLLKWQPTHLSPELYTLDRNALFRMSVTVYNLLSIRTTVNTRLGACSLAYEVASYAMSSAGEEALQEFLLFKLPRAPEGDCLLVLLLAAMRKFEKMGKTGDMRDKLRSWAVNLPALEEVLDRHQPPEPDRARGCAFPGCEVREAWELAAMKKCGCCKAVYYCGTTHQHEHWPEHKRDCKKAES